MITPQTEVSIGSLIHYQMLALMDQFRLNDVLTYREPTPIVNWDEIPELLERSLARSTSRATDLIIVNYPDILAYAYMYVGSGSVDVSIAGASRQQTSDLLAKLSKIVPKTVPSDDTVPITFYAMSNNGHRVFNRKIATPAWADIRDNYSENVQLEMDRLTAMKSGEEMVGGRFILWPGLAGTGKTYSVRALGHEWRKWCKIIYVTDPETFFGSRPDYMLSVLLDDSGRTYSMPFIDDEEIVSVEDNKWNLLVLEDSGKILAPDASMNDGNGLSRFLNVVDGLIGQGLRLITLVTTNEELGKLNPAVQRHGRCSSIIKFEPLSVEKSNDWLLSHGYIDKKVTRPTVLSDLYGLINGKEERNQPRSIGLA